MSNHPLKGVYDSDTLAEIDYIPKNMVVQGGGIIGESVIDHVPFKQECERPNCEMPLFNEVFSKLDARTKKLSFCPCQASNMPTFSRRWERRPMK